MKKIDKIMALLNELKINKKYGNWEFNFFPEDDFFSVGTLSKGNIDIRINKAKNAEFYSKKYPRYIGNSTNLTNSNIPKEHVWFAYLQQPKDQDYKGTVIITGQNQDDFINNIINKIEKQQFRVSEEE